MGKKKEDYYPVLLFGVTLITRMFFKSEFLLNMDSAQFALALEKYDIMVHQPHPPGYFLYILLGKAVSLFAENANSAFVWISILFSGLTIVVVYLLGKEIFGTTVGVTAAIIALTSPTVWFHGEVSLTYILEAFFSSFIAFCCWNYMTGRNRYLWISALALGIAGGIRQNTPVFLFPLWIYSARKAPPGKIAASLGILAGSSLLWFVPMIVETGGWERYHDAFRELWLFHTGGNSVFEQGWISFRLFSFTVVRYIVYGLGACLFPLGLAGYSLFRRKQVRSLDMGKILFFAYWVFPVLFFYTFIFISIQNPGYSLIFLPAFIILAAYSVVYICGAIAVIEKRKCIHVVTSIIISMNAALFFFMNTPVSHRWIRTHDRNVEALLSGIKTFDQAKYAVFVNNYIYYSYRHVMVYLPEYAVYNVDVRTAPTGEERKIFWGIHGKTYLADQITVKEGIDGFITPLDSHDPKFHEKRTYEEAGITIREIRDGLRIAYGPIRLLNRIYPELDRTLRR